MYCKNCGKELNETAKFCVDCGAPVDMPPAKPDETIDDTMEKSSNSFGNSKLADEDSIPQIEPAEQSVGNSIAAEQTEIKSDSEIKGNENTEKTDTSTSNAERNTVEKAADDEPFKINKDDIKEVILPQKGKKGRVKFKDLPKKQKIIRIAIGTGLLLIALIWIVSDGVSGAKKAGNSDSKNDQTQSSEMVELNKEIKTIAYNNDTGALFDLTLDEFSDLFSKTALQITEEVSPETKLNKKWNIKDYWGNKAEPQTGYEETSGEEFTIYTAFFEGTHIAVTTMNEKINSVRVGFDYDNNDLATVYGAVVYSVFSGLDWREAEEKIFNPVKNGIMDNTMIYKDGALFAITTTDCCYLVTASSDKYVSSLKNSGKCNVVYFSDSDKIDTDDVDKDIENSNNVIILSNGDMAFKCTLEEYIDAHNTLYMMKHRLLEFDSLAHIVKEDAIKSDLDDNDDYTFYYWQSYKKDVTHKVMVHKETGYIVAVCLIIEPTLDPEVKKQHFEVVAGAVNPDFDFTKIQEKAEGRYAWDNNIGYWRYADVANNNAHTYNYAAMTKEKFEIVVNSYKNDLDEDTLESPQEEANDKTNISNEQALAALYATSIFEGTGYETAVQHGSFSDVSIGEALDKGFEDPNIEYEKGEECVYITVSGMFYLYSSVRTNASITYRVDEESNVSVYKDSGNIEQKLVEWAVSLASNN